MLSLSLGHVVGGLVLLCSFLQLSQRRLEPMLGLGQFAAFALGLLMFLQAIVQKEWLLYFGGLLIILVQAWVFPHVLRRMANKFGMPVSAKQSLPIVWSMLGGLLFVCIAIVVETPKVEMSLPPEAGTMAMALAVIVLGVWLVIIKAQVLAQIIGILTLENGLVLALTSGCAPGFMVFIVMIALLSVVASMILVANWHYAEKTDTLAKGADS